MKDQFIYLCFLTFFICVSATFPQNPEWINYTNGGAITVVEVEGNFIWVGTSHGGVVKIDKSNGTTTFYNKTNSGLPDNDVSCIAIDGSGNKWIATWGGDLTVYNESGVTEYIEQDKELLAVGYSLHQNYPNPFNPTTVISWQLAVSSDVEVSVYNLLGQKVATLVSEKMPAGLS